MNEMNEMDEIRKLQHIAEVIQDYCENLIHFNRQTQKQLQDYVDELQGYLDNAASVFIVKQQGDKFGVYLPHGGHLPPNEPTR